jgi:hypothetical protein
VFSNGSRHALESGDFDETSGALVFEDLEPSKNLVLNVMSDDLAEYGEHFEVVLENVTGMEVQVRNRVYVTLGFVCGKS